MEFSEYKRNTTDPSLNPEHLTPGGKRKHRKMDKEKRREQIRRYEQSVEDHSSDLIPKGLPEPGQNIKDKKRPVIGIDND